MLRGVGARASCTCRFWLQRAAETDNDKYTDIIDKDKPCSERRYQEYSFASSLQFMGTVMDIANHNISNLGHLRSSFETQFLIQDVPSRSTRFYTHSIAT